MADSRLTKASQTALRDYMGLSQDETMLVVCDENKREIGLALFEAGKEMCNESLYLEMKPREINGEEPPAQVAEMMKAVDLVVCPTTKSLTHTQARREATKLGIRVGTMPGITLATMIRCLSADYNKIIELSDNIAKRLRGVSYIRVVTEAGTDLNMSVRRRKVISSTGVLRNIGEWGNLPSGEVYLAPWEGKSSGVLVIDGSMASIGLIKEPITVVIKDGYAKEITGKNEAQTLVKMLDAVGRDARAVAEFGIGTNYKAKICGDILEDEKVLGTIHIAFGNNISMGGKIAVGIQIGRAHV